MTAIHALACTGLVFLLIAWACDRHARRSVWNDAQDAAAAFLTLGVITLLIAAWWGAIAS